MPRLRRMLASLPEMNNVRLACSVHLEIKMIPLFEALLARGAQLFLTTCNPYTVRLEVVNWLVKNGARAEAWYGMPPSASAAAIQRALDWQPTHLCEMGGELTASWHQRIPTPTGVLASLEGTGSGISRVQALQLCYPVFNCDDLPIKEGVHNRHMVGLTTWQAFFERTRLSLHEKRVLVVGFGSVGRGVADTARAFGGLVWVAERDPARALEAAYAGWEVRQLDEALRVADVIVTATGAQGVLTTQHFAQLRDGAFLLNVGHHADEIELAALRTYPHQEVLPFVEAFQIGDRQIYLFAGGSMANLTAGKGDSLTSFDLTAAVLAAGISHIVQAGATAKPGVQLLPREVWSNCLA